MMLVAVWIVFLLVMLFLLGSSVGSFLNVCIVRLPQRRSLVRPASCCGHCHKPIRMRDNIPLLSYWLLRGRCRACGAPFSRRYFWIELLTGLVFVLIFHLEIGRNIHHFRTLAVYDSSYEYLLLEIFRPRPWLVFAVHALLASFLIVAAMT
ncbi:MAG TPA: prepilin peptidase, partial [Gemmataceae bacterium]